MAEALAVLGALGNVIQLVDFAAKLGSHAAQLIRGESEALRENIETGRLARQYEDLASVIIKAEAEDGPSGIQPTSGSDHARSRKQAVKCAQTCRSEAKQLLAMLDELRMTAQASGWKRVKEGTQIAARFLKKKQAISRHQKALKDSADQLCLALQVASQDKTRALTDEILTELSFAEIKQRERSIHNAFPQTYEWALQDDSFGLRSWLTGDNSLFWVTGKPGSGKSTLMKFLCNDKRSAELLQQWSKDKELVTGHFYFWYLGNALQTSIEGLLRSVLHQIVSAIPEYAVVAWPTRFEITGKEQKPLSLGQQDLTDALRKVATTNIENRNGKKICLFIDGLDELHGDHIELIQLLGKMTRQCSIKICVSSRPWTVFSNSFEAVVPHLRLEDLTRDDIRLYTYNSLRDSVSAMHTLSFHDSDDDCAYEQDAITALIDDITDKAEGVFLWVYLVVRNVRQGVAWGDSLALLRERVREFPPDLDDFFRKLLFDRVDSIYIQQSCQALSLAMSFVECQDGLSRYSSFVDYWLIMQQPKGLERSDFAFSIGPPRASSATMAKQTRRALSAACRDLLSIDKVSEQDSGDVLKLKVTFLHRTIYDFLRTESIAAKLRQNTPDFFWSDRLLPLISLARLRVLYHKGAHKLAWKMADSCFIVVNTTIDAQYVELFTSSLPLKDVVRCSPSFNTAYVLIAFQKHALLRHWFSGGQQALFPLREAHELVHAALGSSSLRSFGPSDIDPDIFSFILSHCETGPGAGVNDSFHATIICSPEQAECSVTSWQSFLQKLSTVYSQQVAQGEALQGNVILQQWLRAADAFLKVNVPLEQPFCCGHAHGQFEHQWCSAHYFLEIVTAEVGLDLQKLIQFAAA